MKPRFPLDMVTGLRGVRYRRMNSWPQEMSKREHTPERTMPFIPYIPSSPGSMVIACNCLNLDCSWLWLLIPVNFVTLARKLWNYKICVQNKNSLGWDNFQPWRPYPQVSDSEGTRSVPKGWGNEYIKRFCTVSNTWPDGYSMASVLWNMHRTCWGSKNIFSNNNPYESERHNQPH